MAEDDLELTLLHLPPSSRITNMHNYAQLLLNLFCVHESEGLYTTAVACGGRWTACRNGLSSSIWVQD